jgi:hypothetical protein
LFSVSLHIIGFLHLSEHPDPNTTTDVKSNPVTTPFMHASPSGDRRRRPDPGHARRREGGPRNGLARDVDVIGEDVDVIGEDVDVPAPTGT